MAYRTPGVYVKEISLFPPSVAEVKTAIPAFIGYTEKAEKKGEDLTDVPTKVKSLLEYRQYFGGESPYEIGVITVDKQNNFAVKSPVPITKRFFMFESLRLFYDNGGGECYIISVGSYKTKEVINSVEAAKLTKGLHALEKYDEPTIIVFPDAVLIGNEAPFYSLQKSALSQCAKLQDRVSVFDLKEGEEGKDWQEAVDAFRNKIGINNLKYGAAYTPWLYTAYEKQVDFKEYKDKIKDVPDLSKITSDDKLNDLVKTANQAIKDRDTVIKSVVDTAMGKSPSLLDEFKRLKDEIVANSTPGDNEAFTDLMNFVRTLVLGNTTSPPVDGLTSWAQDIEGKGLKADLEAEASSSLGPALEGLIALEKELLTFTSPPSDESEVNDVYSDLDNASWLGKKVQDIGATNLGTLEAILSHLDGLFYQSTEQSIKGFIDSMISASKIQAKITQNLLLEGHAIISNIDKKVKKELSKVPPSGAVAGRYAFVDDTRGVWKAPANVSINWVQEPVQNIDFFDQEDLNIDVNAGKSINAIRSFTGRGAAIIWGARTLAGNDNEWRYVPVRRFFNMVEESVKKSTAWAVFEPNSAPLWTQVKSMIANYLIQKWREGALAGATPDEAFFVKAGLNETMTPQDILEGRLIVEIGMAVVRPAEFIILKFSHKMQES